MARKLVEPGIMFIDRTISGASLAKELPGGVDQLMDLVVSQSLTPFGFVRQVDGGVWCATDLTIKKPDDLVNLDPEPDKFVVCFDRDDVEKAPKQGEFEQMSSTPSTPSTEMDELKSQLALAQQEIERLKSNGQSKQSKTVRASEAAQDSRVETWKRYASVMAKIAYQCGLEGRKGVTRPKFMEMAKPHGALSDTALELLREALPDVARTTSGAPTQG